MEQESTEKKNLSTTRSTKLRELPTHAQNPFVIGSDLVPEQKKRTEIVFTKNQAVINTETGELSGDHIAMAKIKTVEADQFVKVYAKHMHILFELGKPAQRVCEFVMHQVSSRALNKGEVVLSFPEYEERYKGKTGGTRQTFMRGLQELASKNLIAKSLTRDIWFINPAIIFNGERARFITEIRRKSKHEELEAEGQQRLLD